MVKNIYLIVILFAALFLPGNIFAQKYVVGGDFDYATFSFIDKTGKPNGLDIDVLKAIAVSSGIKLSFQLSRWDSALSYIQSQLNILKLTEIQKRWKVYEKDDFKYKGIAINIGIILFKISYSFNKKASQIC